MLRKNMKLRIASDHRGKITTGIKAKNAKGVEYPKALDYFNISDFPELLEVYGEKPAKLLVLFPSINIEDFLFSEWSEWGGSGDTSIKKISCDGETCNDLVNNTTKPCQHPACKCKAYTGLKAWVADPNTGVIINPVPYRFQTLSPNSGDSLYSAILLAWQMVGGKILGVPFVLSVKMVEKLVEGKKNRFPIWDLQPAGTVHSIMAYSQRGLIPTGQGSALSIDATTEIEPLAIAAPVEVVEDEPQPPTNGTPQPDDPIITDKQLKALWASVKQHGIDQNALRKVMKERGYDSTKDLRQNDFTEIMEWIKLASAGEPA